MPQPEISFRLESRHLQSRLMALVMIAIGLFLVTLAGNEGAANSESAKYLGAFLIAGGTLGLFWLDQIILEVSRTEKCLVLTRRGLFEGPRKQKIPQTQIQEVLVKRIGSKWKGLETHHLILKTQNQQINTGYWKRERREIEVVANQLIQALELKGHGDLLLSSEEADDISESSSPFHSRRLAISFAVGLIVYVAWYRLSVGPWCPAMWAGTAPPYIIGLVTLFTFQFLRNRVS